MAKQTINIGASPNDGTGTPLRTSFDYCNQNFTELYTSLGGGTGLPGLNGEVIFNNGTSLAGDPAFVFDAATDMLSVTGFKTFLTTQLSTIGTLYVGTLATPKLKVDVAGTGITTITQADITGDLTVRTNRLIVNSNGAGIGTTPSAWGAGTRGFELANGSVVSFAGYIGTVGTANSYYNGSNWIYTTTAAAARYDQDNGSHIWFNAPSGTAGNTVGWSTAMTLNSTGLGVGASPLGKFDAYSTGADTNVFIRSDTTRLGQIVFRDNADSGNQGRVKYDHSTDTLSLYSNGNENLFLNSSGNVGVGVTPSAWGSNSKALQVGGGSASVSSTGAGSTASRFAHGAYFDNTNWLYQYTGVGPALYQVTGANAGSTHAWYIAPGGTAGTAFTFTQAMTLDASGNLLVGVTSANANGGVLQLKSGITFPATQVASSDANTLDDYEEGTWTPTVGDASSGGNQGTTATAVGRYTKIGRLVTVQFELTDIDTTGLTAGNSLYIRGLPFTASSATTQYGTITGVGITFSGFLTCGVFNSTAFPIYQTSSGGSLADIKVSGFASGTADIWGTLTYIV